MQTIEDDDGARRLATLLNSPGRTRPVLVVTTPARAARPLIDADRLQDEVGDVVDVYVIAAGDHGWEFSRLMPDRTQVYGGAGRCYPVGHAWVTDPRRSPLRFAFDAADGARTTALLETDALSMAAAAGLFDRAPSDTVDVRRGEVKGVPHPERAVVRLEGGALAGIIPELAAPGEPLARVLAPGMQVTGRFYPDTGRLDVRDSLLSPEESLASYEVEQVVLARVEAVEADHATVRLHPSIVVPLSRDDVTSNPLDDLRSMMTVGEVLPARLVAGAPEWRLSLLDVDDDEVPLPAAALLAGGPPWLLPPLDEPAPDDAPPSSGTGWVQPSSEPLLAPDVGSVAEPDALPEAPIEPTPPQAPEPEPSPAAAPAARKLPVPDPRRLDPARRARVAPPPPATPPSPQPRPRPGPPRPVPRPVPTPAALPAAVVAPTPAPPARKQVAVETLSLTNTALKSELKTAKDEIATLTNERNELRTHLGEIESEQRRAADELRRLRAALRKSRQRPRSEATSDPSPEFADPDLGFRYAVTTAWARRTPVGEQRAHPLPDYDLGPRFLDSLATCTGVSVDKVADVVFEVLTGRADSLTGREVHQLREGAPGTPYVRREHDNATCWRAALQVATPQARRLHYWRGPGGRIELSRVVLHDDVDP